MSEPWTDLLSRWQPQPLGLNGNWLTIWATVMDANQGQCSCVGACGKSHATQETRRSKALARCKTVHSHRALLSLVEDADGACAIYCPPCYRGVVKSAQADNAVEQEGIF